jgi:hypothetical protein
LPAVGREDAAKVKHVSVEEARVKVQGVVQILVAGDESPRKQPVKPS